MQRAEPQLDFTKLSFPTDDLMIRTIRGLRPELISTEPPLSAEEYDELEDIRGVMWIERVLAHKAFAAARGKPDPYANDDLLNDRRDLILGLSRDYDFYGLSSGIQHTRQLVRAFEEQAAAQARAPRGRDRRS